MTCKTYDFIRKRWPQGAVSMIAQLLDAIAGLDTFPHRSQIEHQSKKTKHPVRSVPVWPYIIYFRVLDPLKAVRVLTVRRGARRRPRRFD